MKELSIGGVIIGLDEGFGIDFVKEVASFQNPDERRSDYTKSITFVGTKEVNKLFNHYYDVNVDSTFNPQKKIDAVYYEDSVEQIRGFFRLVKVTVDGGVITYEGTLHGELSNLFKDMGDAYISDLDWTDLSHTYDEATIRANWAAASIGTGYYYPMIDYLGKASSIAYNTWQVTDFRPGVWYKEIWNRIFEKYGYTYSSYILEDAIFNQILMPSKSDVITLTAQQILDRSYYVGKTGDTQNNQEQLLDGIFNTDIGYLNTPIKFSDDTTGSFYNSLTNEWTTTGDIYYLPLTGGLVDFTFDLDLKIKYLGSNTVDTGVTFKVKLKKYQSSPYTPSRSIELASWDGSATFGSSPVTNDETPSVNITDVGSIQVVPNEVYFITVENIEGTFNGLYSGKAMGSNWAVVTESTSTFKGDYKDTVVTPGNQMLISSALPKMKQKDFIMSVVKAFNLLIEPDGDKHLEIQTYDHYYLDNYVDWTNKRDGALTLEPNKQLKGKQYNFLFEKEKDYLHKKFLEDTETNYGDLHLAFDNDFLTEEKTIKLNIASTISAADASVSDRPIATMYDIDANSNFAQIGTFPRMLWCNGMVVTSINWTFATGGATETSYPYAGITRAAYGSLASSDYIPSTLAFQPAVIAYYDGDYPAPGTNTVAYGGETLYSMYSNMIDAIQRPVMTCTMLLSTMDIYNLSFRDRYFIDTAHYRLLRVEKVGDKYKCEFLKDE